MGSPQPSRHSLPQERLLPKEETARLQRYWRAAAPMHTQLPIRFANGSSVQSYSGACSCCSKNIEPDDFRGRISFPIPSVAVLESVGVCHDCRIITRFYHRLRDDFTLEWVDDSGKWTSKKVSPSSTLGESARRLLRRLGIRC